MTILLAGIHARGELHSCLRSHVTRVLVPLEEVGGPFVVTGSGACRTGGPQARGAVSVIPAGMDARGEAVGLRYMRHLIIQFDKNAWLEAMGDEIDLSRALKPRLMDPDRRLTGILRIIADECAVNASVGRLVSDGLAIALLAALARGEAPDDEPARPRSGLAPWQVRKATDYLLAHLSGDVQTSQLADLVGLSKSHFSRGFKENTGLSPHRWLLNARVDRAKSHLLAGRLSLAEIALDVGFADQSHFTRTFSKLESTSPRAWLRQRL